MTRTSRTERDRGLTLADALNAALDAILADDERALIIGEDIGAVGGVFRITRGLLAKHGPDRVVDAPLGEAGIVGTAVGLALNGLRPIVEIQFDGFVYPALNQICGHVAKYSARLDREEQLPLIIRLPIGGRIGAAEFHSESPEALFAHTPELCVVAASTPDTGAALLRSVYASRQACIFLEPKRLYRRGRISRDAQAKKVDHARARVLRSGGDATIVTYGPCVPDALDAADSLEAEGHRVGVVDLVSLAPIDRATVVDEVRRSGRLAAVTEAVRRCSIASEITAIVASEAFDALRSAPRIVASPNAPPPPPEQEDGYFPNAESIVKAVKEMVSD